MKMQCRVLCRWRARRWGILIPYCVLSIMCSGCRQGLHKTSFGNLRPQEMTGVGIKITLPANGVKVFDLNREFVALMHPLYPSGIAEPRYCIKVSVDRFSAGRYELEKQRSTSVVLDPYNMWRTDHHPSIASYTANRWCFFRLDKKCPNGDFLFIEGGLDLGMADNSDVLAVSNILESVEALY